MILFRSIDKHLKPREAEVFHGRHHHPFFSSHVAFWLQADIQPPEIDFRFAPNFGHSEAHAGLPLLTQLGHLGVRSANQLEPKISDPRT